MMNDRMQSRRRRISTAAMLFVVIAVARTSLPEVAHRASGQAPVPAKKPAATPNLNRIFVPLDAFDSLLENTANGVLMRRTEFLELYRQAQLAKKDAKLPPSRAIVLNSAKYIARIAGDQLTMTAEVDFRAFDPGWSTLQLPFTTMRLERATVNGQPAMIGRGPKKSVGHTLLHQGAGNGKLLLELSTPLHRAGGDRVAALEFLGGPIATLEFALPKGKSLFVDGLEPGRKTGANATEIATLSVGRKRRLPIRISDGKQARPVDDVLIATSQIALLVQSGGADWRSETTVEPFGKQRSQLELTVPSKLRVTKVESLGLESWQWKPGADEDTRSVITLRYRRPISGPRVITLHGMFAIEPGDFWPVPNLILTTADSHVGRLNVAHPHRLHLRVDEYDGVRLNATKPNAAKTPAKLRTLSFNIWRENFDLMLVTEPDSERITANAATLISIGDDGVRMTFSATLASKRRLKYSDLAFSLPAGWKIDAMTVDGQPVDWFALPREVNVQHLRIRSKATRRQPPKTGPRTLIFQARHTLEFSDGEKSTADVKIPEVRLQAANAIQGTIAIVAENSLDVSLTKLASLTPAKRSPGQRYALRYTAKASTETWYAGDVHVARKPARIAIRTLIHTRLEASALRSFLQIEFDIQGSGVRQLTVSLPESVSDRLRFRMSGGPGRITEQTAAVPANGRRIWTLVFDRRLSGMGTIAASLESDRKRLERAGERFLAHTVVIPEAQRQSGFVVIEAADDQRLDVVTSIATPPAGEQAAVGRPLDEIDPVELPVFLRRQSEPRYVPRQRIVAAYRYIVPGYRVTFAEEKLAGPTVPVTICRASTIESVVSATGEIQHRASYQLKTGGIQGLLVQLPEGAQLWATLVDRKPQEVRKQAGGLFVPLAAHSHADVTLELFFHTSVELPEGVGDVAQTAPRLRVIRGAGQGRPLEILERTWTVHTPPSLLVVESSGRFHPDNPPESSSLLMGWGRTISLGAFDSLWAKLAAIVLIGAVILMLVVSAQRHGTNGVMAVAAVFVIIGLAVMIPMVLSTTRQDITAEYYGSAARSVQTSAVGRQQGGEDSSFGPRTYDPSLGGKSASKTSSARPGTMAGLDGREEQKAPQKAPQRKSESPFKSAAPPPVPQDAKPGRRTVTKTPASPNRAPATGKPKGGRGERDTEEGKQSSPTPEAAPQETYGKRFASARLSVVAELQPPDDHVASRFRYYGSSVTEDDETDDALLLVTENQSTGVALRICIAFAVVLTFWFSRSRSPRTRGLLVALGIAMPPAIVAFAPVLWHVALDGIFCGAVVGGVLWLTWFAVRCGCCGKPRRTSAWTASSLLLVIGLAQHLTATPAAAQPRKPIAANKTSAKSPLSLRAKRDTVIIPYDETNTPPTADRVLVPYAEFARLWKLAHPNGIVRPASPVEGLVAQAFHSATVKPAANSTPSILAVKSRVVLYSFRDRRIVLPVPLGNVAFRSAKLDGTAAAIIHRTAGKSKTSLPFVAVSQPGMHVLDLEYDVAITPFGDGGRAVIPLQPVSSGTFSFQLPAIGQQVSVNGQTGAYRRNKRDGKESVVMGIDRGGDLDLRWNTASQRAAATAILHAEIQTAITIDNHGVQQRSTISLAVRRGKTNAIAIKLPTGLKLRRLSGADVAGWQTERKAGGNRLQLFLKRTLTDQTQIVLELYQPVRFSMEDTEVAFAPLPVEDVSRRNETVHVQAEEQFVVRVKSRDGFTQVAAPASKSKRPTGFRLSLRTNRHDARLQLSVARPETQTVVTATHAVWIDSTDVKLHSRFVFDFKNTQQSKIVLLLPEEFTLETVTTSIPAQWSTGEDATAVYVRFNAPETRLVQVDVIGSMAREPKSDDVTINTPSPVTATSMSSYVAVRLASGLDATVTNSDGWQATPAGRMPQRLRLSSPQPIRFGFASSDVEPNAIALKVTQTEPVLRAAAVTLIQVADIAVHQTLVMKWSGLISTSDVVAFSVPKWLADQLDFSVTPGVNVRRAGGPQPVMGRVRFVARAESLVGGSLVIVGTAVLPAPIATGNRVKAPVLDLGRQKGAEFVSLNRQSHVAVISNHSDGKIEAEKPKTLTRVSKNELPASIVFDDEMTRLIHRAVDRVRIATGSPEPVWLLRKLAMRRIGTAVVNRADLTTVIAHDGTWRAKAVYTVKNQRRQFLALILPAGSRVLSVVVRGRPARTVNITRNEREYTLIPLPLSGEADLALNVRLILAGSLPDGPLPQGVNLRADRINLPATHVVTNQEDDKFGMPVARTIWTVHFPNDFDIASVTESDVTNVTESSEVQQSEFVELTNLHEYNEQFRILSSKDSGKKKRLTAMSNLKQLQSKISALQDRSVALALADEGQSNSDPAGKQQLANERAAFSRNYLAIQEANRTRGGEEDFKEKLDKNESLKLLTQQGQALVIQDNAKGIVLGNNDAGFKSSLKPGGYVRGPTAPFTPPSDGVPGGTRTGSGRRSLDMDVAVSFGPSPDVTRGKLGGDQRLPQASTKDGTLSLDVEFATPEHSQVITFTKPGGQPKLQLSVRPRKTQQTAMRFLFSAVWIAIGIGIVLAFTRVGSRSSLSKSWPLIAAATGAVIACLLSGPLSIVGFGLFIVGAAAIALRRSSAGSQSSV